MANPVLSSVLSNARKSAPAAPPAPNQMGPNGTVMPTAPYPTGQGAPMGPSAGVPMGYVPQAQPGATLGPDHLGQWTAISSPDRLTYDDVIVKTGALLATVVITGAVGWFIPALSFPAMLVGLVLGLVNSFKKTPSPALIVAYAVAEGLFLGGLSGVLEALYPGIAIQAVLGTVCVFGVMLALYKSGKIRVRGKFAKVMLIALAGYALFSLINLVLQLTGVLDGWGIHSMTVAGIPLGIPIGLLAVGLAAMCLVMDFDAVQTAVEQGAPRQTAWFAAFGLTVTLVWLYVELLRLLSLLRN